MCLHSTVHTLKNTTSAFYFSTLSNSSQCHTTTTQFQQLTNIYIHSTVHLLKSTNSAFHFITHSPLSHNTPLHCSKHPQVKSAPHFIITVGSERSHISALHTTEKSSPHATLLLAEELITYTQLPPHLAQA